MTVTGATLIEDLVREVPGSVEYLMKNGIKCLACGEPIWGSLETAAGEKGYKEEQILVFISELNKLSQND